MPVSFNLSHVDFAETDPYKATEDCVKKYGINRKLLKVEITESTLISDPAKLHSMLDFFMIRDMISGWMISAADIPLSMS